MKASEEIGIDFFIQKCVESGIDTRFGIIEQARKESERDAERVKNFLLEGKSNPYEDYVEWESCIDCGNNLLFDEKKQEQYCPICES